jgi:sensor histidine kinase YesM
MTWNRYARVALPVFFALLIILGVILCSHLLVAQPPTVKSGILRLGDWKGDSVFEITGEWEFYWDKLLTEQDFRKSSQTPMLVNAPTLWNKYEINGSKLPGKGSATYHIVVTEATAGTEYGVRIQDMATSYRLYIDNTLIAQNGNFRDSESAPASAYRPQLVTFTTKSDRFDIVLQVCNNFHGLGGMWQPILFGTGQQVTAYDRWLFGTVTSATAGLMVSCFIFIIFFIAQRREKDTLILSVLGLIIILRLSIIGDVAFTRIFPNTPIAWLSRIDFLTMPWAQFLLLFFIYSAYGDLIRKRQVIALFIYTVSVSLFILLFPLTLTTSAYMIMNYILLLVMIAVVMQLTRAAWLGREGATVLLAANLLILLFICYEMLAHDYTVVFYLIKNSGFEYLVFIFAQMTVVALRYRQAQRLEIAHLKGQLRPHFIHNALTSIISISRKDPERARELLVDFSSYLRGFYDYDRDELVSLEQEMELVNAYTSLEQARFGDKFHLDCDFEVHNFLLPSLSLQPLVENALVHGLREKDSGGTVIVYTRRMMNCRVRLGVRDDGIGFSSQTASRRKGVGIENINHRLARLYRTSLVYLTPEGGGCEVYFEIPYKEAENY